MKDAASLVVGAVVYVTGGKDAVHVVVPRLGLHCRPESFSYMIFGGVHMSFSYPQPIYLEFLGGCKEVSKRGLCHGNSILIAECEPEGVRGLVLMIIAQLDCRLSGMVSGWVDRDAGEGRNW